MALAMNTWEMAALLKGKFNSVRSQQFIFYASLKGWLDIIFNLTMNIVCCDFVGCNYSSEVSSERLSKFTSHALSFI